MDQPDFTTLPDLCLLRVFDYLPPAELLRLDLICPRLGSLKAAACNRRLCLQIVVNRCQGAEPTNLFDRTFFEIPYQEELVGADGDGLVKTVNDQFLQYSMIDQTTAQHLGATFPNIKHLKLAIKINYQHYQLTRSTDTDDFLYLLSLWSPKLVSFNLSCHYDYHFYWDNLREHQGVNIEISRQLTNILGSVNSMVNLKSLALVFSNYFNLDNSQIIDLPILGQLEEFNFFSYDHPKMLISSLKRYAASNGKLAKICINNEPYLFRKDYSKDFLELDPDLARKFTRISRVYYPFSEVLFANYHNLTSLQIEQNFDLLEHLTITELSAKLSSLSQLLHLRVHLITTQNRTLALDDQIEPEEVTRLSSVKVLQLHLSGSSHLDVHSAHFGTIFPQLQVLQVQYYHWQCLPCRYDLRASTLLKTQIKCYQKAVVPWWGQCTKLKKVFAFAWAEGRYVEIEPKKEKVNAMGKIKNMMKKIL